MGEEKRAKDGEKFCGKLILAVSRNRSSTTTVLVYPYHREKKRRSPQQPEACPSTVPPHLKSGLNSGQ